MARAILFLAILALAACSESGGRREPFTDVRLPPSLPLRFWAPDGWAWGLIKVGDHPAVRYGVAAPKGASVGHIIILPGYGESAEGWFETAANLIDRGYTVWVREGVGQGGSAHSGRPASRDFEADIEGLSAFDQVIVRPTPGEPVTVLASGLSDLTALAAIERGYRPARLILSDPLGPLPASGPWKRKDPQATLSPRRRASDGWSLANPDLRVGGPSRSWIKARDELQASVMAQPLTQLASPVVVITPTEGRFPCARLPVCREVVIPANEAYPFAGDVERDRWLAAVVAAASPGAGP